MIHEKAFVFAERAHGSQKYGDKPYIYHLAAVVRILREFGYEEETILAAGWLHDVVEDTKVTRDDVDAEFGQEVADLVWAVTGVGENRKARNRSIHEKIMAYPKAAIIKTADRIANVESSKIWQPRLFAMYQKEGQSFIDLVADKIPAAMLARLKAALA